MQTQSQ
jgi:hypothetical protein